MSSRNIITRAQRKSPLEISNPNRPLFYLQLFEYMTSDNPVANCVPNSNCSHGNFKYREHFPASLRREDVGFLALFGSDGAGKPGCATALEPRWHRLRLHRRDLLASGSSTTDLRHVQTVTVPFASQGSAPGSDYCKDKQLHLGQQARP